MPLGGVRRRPGPLLGGSAILAKRNNQQRQQYIQQLQTLVQQKENNHKNKESNTVNSLQPEINNQNSSSGFDNRILPNTIVGNVQNLAQNNEIVISNPYPDLLSHEVGQQNIHSNYNYLPSSLYPTPNDYRNDNYTEVSLETAVQTPSEPSQLPNYIKSATVTELEKQKDMYNDFSKPGVSLRITGKRFPNSLRRSASTVSDIQSMRRGRNNNDVYIL